MLRVNTVRTVNGMDSIRVGTMDTRATNQDCSTNSRHANGGLKSKITTSNAMAKNPPTARSGAAKDAVGNILTAPPNNRTHFPAAGPNQLHHNVSIGLRTLPTCPDADVRTCLPP